MDVKGDYILTKKGHASLKLVKPVSDKSALYAVKHKYGGSVKSIAGSNSFRYKLHHSKGLMCITDCFNGNIINRARLIKLKTFCSWYSVKVLKPKAIKFYNGWLSGFIDGNCSRFKGFESCIWSKGPPINEIYRYPCSNEITGIKQNRVYQDYYICAFVGPNLPEQGLQISNCKKEEVIGRINKYFSIFPLRSSQKQRLNIKKKGFSYVYSRVLYIDRKLYQ